MIGAFFGFFIGVFSLVNPLVSVLVLVLYGLIFGAIIGLISHALSGGRRDFSSVGGIEAGRYNVMVDEEVAKEASRLIAGLR